VCEYCAIVFGQSLIRDFWKMMHENCGGSLGCRSIINSHNVCNHRLATGCKVWGSNLGAGRNFLHLFRLALRCTQPPVQWILGLPWGKGGKGMVLTTHPI
jgi:hypothetical protein